MQVTLYRKNLTTGKIDKVIQDGRYIMGYDENGWFCRCSIGLEEKTIQKMIDNNLNCTKSGFLWSLREIKE